MKALNPTVSMNNGTVTAMQLRVLSIALHEVTGLWFGYLPQEMEDTSIKSFVLTLCGKKTMNKITRRVVDAAIRAWAIGAGYGNPRISWPDLY